MRRSPLLVHAVYACIALYGISVLGVGTGGGGGSASDGAQHSTKLEEVENKLKKAQHELETLRSTHSTTAEVTKLRNAFSQLLSEKQELVRAVRAEHEQLMTLQKRIRNPSLGIWLENRASLLRSVLELPETEALAYYARLYMKPKLGKARDGLAALERHLESGVDHVLPAKYGTWLAVLLTILLVGVPCVVVLRLALSLSRTLSLAQYVLLVNVFLSVLCLALLVARLVIAQDPLDTLHQSTEHLFVVTQLLLGIAFPVFMMLLAGTAWQASKRRNGTWYMFACQIVFYIMVAANYRKRVWHPTMMGEVIHANVLMYIVYLIDFLCMTALTIGAARNSERPTFATRRSNDYYLPTAAAKKRVN